MPPAGATSGQRQGRGWRRPRRFASPASRAGLRWRGRSAAPTRRGHASRRRRDGRASGPWCRSRNRGCGAAADAVTGRCCSRRRGSPTRERRLDTPLQRLEEHLHGFVGEPDRLVDGRHHRADRALRARGEGGGTRKEAGRSLRYAGLGYIALGSRQLVPDAAAAATMFCRRPWRAGFGKSCACALCSERRHLPTPSSVSMAAPSAVRTSARRHGTRLGRAVFS